MPRACRVTATGKWLEIQSDATEGTLVANAVLAGYAPGDVEEVFCTDEESQTFLAEIAIQQPREIRVPLRLIEINKAVNAYICSHYDMGTQASFQAVYVMDGTPLEVKTALLGVWAWVQSVLGYYYTKKAEIAAAADPETVTWDFTQFDATDPQVSLQSLVVA